MTKVPSAVVDVTVVKSGSLIAGIAYQVGVASELHPSNTTS